MYKKILCAVDVKSEDESTIEKAFSMAEQYNAKLFIVHVIEYTFLPKDYQKNLKEEVLPKIKELSERYGILKKNRFVKFGQSYAEICALEEKHNIDLIVIGSHGKHGIKALLGSTANAVLQQANCDVMLVKLNKV